MSSISECNNNISMYNDMKSKVVSIINNLDYFNDNSSKLLFKVEQNYTLDSDNTAIYYRIKGLRTDVNKTSNYLKNTIIPGIDAAIAKERNTIADIEAQQRAEAAAKAAEAERQRKSSSSNSGTSNTKKTKPKLPASSYRCPLCGSRLIKNHFYDYYCGRCKKDVENMLRL